MALTPGLLRAEDDADRSFPFEMTRNTPWTRVVINDGEPPEPFLLDTGNEVFGIRPEAAERHKLRREGTRRAATTRYQPVVTYQAERVSAMPVIRANGVTLALRSEVLPLDLQGILPIAEFGELGIRFSDRRVTGATKFDRAAAGYRKIPLVENADFLAIRAVLDGEPVRLHVVTSNTGPIRLSSAFVAKRGLFQRYAPGRDLPVRGGGTPARLTRAGQLVLGENKLDGPLVLLSPPQVDVSAGAPQTDGVIGIDLIRRFDLIIDRRDFGFWARPTAALREPYRHNRSGMELVLRDGRPCVADIVPGGPAAKAGVAVGDVFAGWSGRDGLERLAWAMQDASGVSVEIDIERDGKTRKAALTLAEPF